MFSYGTVACAAICYNEELLIAEWIDHVLSSSIIEFVSLVDCGSTDKTVEIIKEKQRQYPSRIHLEFVDWDKNFSKLRNQSLIPLRKKDVTWALWIDIDTFFNVNPDEFFEKLDDKPLYLYNDIRLPSLRFWLLSKTMGDKIPVPQHWGLVRLSSLSGFVGNLHEQVLMPDHRILKLTPVNMKDVWLAHYDLAKLNKLALIKGISLAAIMGGKKKRYLDIRKITGSLSPLDPDPDLLTVADIEKFGNEKIEEELSSNPLSNFDPTNHCKEAIRALSIA